MTQNGLRVLALVTDAFGGHGGIAQYNRDLLSSLAACELVSEVIVLPRRATDIPADLPVRLRQLGPVESKLAFSFAALAAARTLRPINVVFCGHLFMVPLAASLAKLIGARLWVQVHGFEAWRELSMLHRQSVESAALVTSVSRYTRQRLMEWVRIEPYRVKVLPNTVDGRFHSGPKPSYLLQRHALNNTKVLLTVSRLTSWDRYKGHDRVIRTLPRVLRQWPDTIYLIVGDGDDRQRLEALAKEFDVSHKVHFTGTVTQEELPDYFRLADVFVMPSTGEGFGIVFLEAMASGLHVIGGNQDGSLDALCGTFAATVDPDNSEELASAIHAALTGGPALQTDGTERFRMHLFRQYLHELLRAIVSPNQCDTEADHRSVIRAA